MYKYKHTLKLSDVQLVKDIDLTEYESIIDDAVIHYNNVSSTAKNKKQIVDFTVTPSYIEIISESTEALARPNNALQVFSRFLAEKKEFKKLIRNKLLFRGAAEKINAENENLTEDELLLEIIKIFRKGDKKAQEKIEQFRKIIED